MGVRLYGIRRLSLLGLIGLMNGDRIVSVQDGRGRRLSLHARVLGNPFWHLPLRIELNRTGQTVRLHMDGSGR